MLSGIYEIQNLVNGKVYIGSSVNLNSRKIRHKYLLKNDLHLNQKLQKAVNKYGFNNFEFKVIHLCKIKDLPKLEQWYIDVFDCVKNGYNILPNVKTSYGYSHSSETKFKISKGNTGVLNHNSKLDESKVQEIRYLYTYKKWLMKDLALKFGIGRRGISNVISRTRWKDVVDKNYFPEYD